MNSLEIYDEEHRKFRSNFDSRYLEPNFIYF